MGFKAFRVERTTSGDWRLSDGMPVRFSGPNGLVAMWCRANREIADRPWKVAPFEWLHLMMPPAEATARWLVFEQEENGRMLLSRLLSVAGVAARTVELMFNFAPLEVVRPEPDLRVSDAGDGRLWSEELALDGGLHSAGCSWRWTRSQLALGATTIRPVPFG